jgi:hypothetical protein
LIDRNGSVPGYNGRDDISKPSLVNGTPAAATRAVEPDGDPSEEHLTLGSPSPDASTVALMEKPSDAHLDANHWTKTWMGSGDPDNLSDSNLTQTRCWGLWLASDVCGAALTWNAAAVRDAAAGLWKPEADDPTCSNSHWMA